MNMMDPVSIPIAYRDGQSPGCKGGGLRIAGMTSMILSLLLVSLPACRWKLSPTYPASKISSSLRQLCERDYKLSVETRHIRNSLQAHFWNWGLFNGDARDLQAMSREAMQALEHILLCSTRIALSTDAKLDFIEVRLADVLTGASITLWRYVPDIHDSMRQRFGDTEYINRLLINIEPGRSSDPIEPRQGSLVKSVEWNEPMTLSEFLAKQVIMRARREAGDGFLAHPDLTEPATLGVVIEDWARIAEKGPEQAAHVTELLHQNAQKVVRGYRFDGFREIVLRDGRGAPLRRWSF